MLLGSHTIILVAGTKRKHRCNQCPQCIADDCGACRLCLDKPKFRGKGSMKQCCIKHRCTVDLTIQSTTGTSTNPCIILFKSAEFVVQGEKTTDTISIDTFLLSAGCKWLPVKGDGNCMFRSLAF